MRQSWLLIVPGLLLVGGAAYIGLHHSHLDIDVGSSGVTVAHLSVDCGSPLFREYPLPAGLQFSGKGPCASSPAMTRQLIGAALAAAAGVDAWSWRRPGHVEQR